MIVRTRYAPSPTGLPHVGNMRAALFDWLLARNAGGTFILRIEDTDRERYVDGGVEAQMEALRWLGLDWDEGPDVGGPHAPYTQSERLALYLEAAERLVANGKAYHCFCTPERLGELRRQQQAAKQPPGYDRRCRALPPQELAERLEADEPNVIRFASPTEGETSFRDAIRGVVTVENRTIDDFVILKSDGYPTYHLASVVDDKAMAISHVFRGDEWIPSAPRHALIYTALGYEPSLFVHLPSILGADRKRLAKRHGSTTVLEYRDAGYLPEAMVNFLALLGWSLDDKTEIIDRETLVRSFSLDRVSATPGIFDADKLRWMNGEYIRALPEDELARRILPFLQRELPETAREPDLELVGRIVPLIQTRMELLADAYPLTAFFFTREILVTADDLLGKRFASEPEVALAALTAATERLGALPDWTHEGIQSALRGLGEELGLKPRDFFGLLRMAVTGSTVSPPLFESLEILGREVTLERIGDAGRTLRPAAG
ncbi:MAG: glutamate--tRNA ligase [Dehalococcoidia bacterium]|nr:glutamate--tRNA ligase [Dehalococcoidia bacterium]